VTVARTDKSGLCLSYDVIRVMRTIAIRMRILKHWYESLQLLSPWEKRRLVRHAVFDEACSPAAAAQEKFLKWRHEPLPRAYDDSRYLARTLAATMLDLEPAQRVEILTYLQQEVARLVVLAEETKFGSLDDEGGLAS
jgi:hypothetical protein